MRNRRLAAMAFVFCALVAACGDDGDAEAEGTRESTSASPSTGSTDEGGTDDVALDPDATIRIITAAPTPGSWDPATTLSPNQDIQFYAYVYDTLLRLNADNELEPRLATAWEYDETRTRLTLTLRDDVTFTDGTPFNADAAKLNLDRVRTGTGGAARILNGISSIEVVSPTELVIVQAAPSAKVVFSLATTAASMASPLAIEDPQALAQNPVGSGPYLLDSATTTTSAFVRNDDYWDQDEDVVYAARHELTSATDANARMNAMLSGNVDFAQITQTALTPDIEAGVEDGSLQIFTVSAQASSIGVNNNVAPLDNPKVVEAINLAIDRETYNEVVYDGTCKPTSQVFVDGMLGHVDGLEYDFDVERAQQLMDEAGVGDITISYQGVAGAPTAPVELLQSMLAEIGVTLEVTQSPIQEVFPNFFSGRFGLSALALFLTVPDPSYVTDYITGFLNPGTKAPELVEMVNEANAMDVSDPARGAAYEDINRYVFENPVMVPLCQTPVHLIANPDVVGIDRIPFATINALDMTRLGMRAE